MNLALVQPGSRLHPAARRPKNGRRLARWRATSGASATCSPIRSCEAQLAAFAAPRPTWSAAGAGEGGVDIATGPSNGRPAQ